MSHFVFASRKYSRQFLSIAVFMGVDFFTGMVEYLRALQDGTIKIGWLSLGIFISMSIVSLLNVIKAAQSQAWTKASGHTTVKSSSTESINSSTTANETIQ